MTVFQLILLAASAFFAYKIYEHIQTLEDPRDDSTQDDYEGGSAMQTAQAFSPFGADDLIEKADNAFLEKDNQKALAFLYEANEKDRNNEEILFKIGYILQDSGNQEEAINYYKDALTLDKRNEVVHNAIASLYRARGEYKAALTHLKASISIDDANPITYFNFGNLYLDMKEFEEAKEMYKKALELNPEFKEAKEELERLLQE